MSELENERRRRFDALFATYSSDIVASCGWRAGSASDAQDAVADVFLTAWRRLDELPEGDAARVWLYATARRVIANQRRSNRRRTALHDRLAREAASAANDRPTTREESLVHDALELLAPRDREILLLPRGRACRPRRSRRSWVVSPSPPEGVCIGPDGASESPSRTSVTATRVERPRHDDPEHP